MGRLLSPRSQRRVGIGKALFPGADHLLLAGVDVDGFDLSKRVIGLGVNEVDAAVIERVADIVIKGIGIEIAVDAGDGNHDRVGRALFLRAKQHAVEYNAALCGHVEAKHLVIQGVTYDSSQVYWL